MKRFSPESEDASIGNGTTSATTSASCLHGVSDTSASSQTLTETCPCQEARRDVQFAVEV